MGLVLSLSQHNTFTDSPPKPPTSPTSLPCLVSHPTSHNSLAPLPTPALFSQAPQFWSEAPSFLICLSFACSLWLEAGARGGGADPAKLPCDALIFPLLLISSSGAKRLPKCSSPTRLPSAGAAQARST